MEWSWPLFVRITRHDLGWSRAGPPSDILHPGAPAAAVAVTNVQVACARSAAVAATATVTVAQAAAARPTRVAGVTVVPAVAAAGSNDTAATAAVGVAVATAAVATAIAAPAVTVVAVAPAAAVPANPAPPLLPPASTPGGSLGLPQLLVMLEVPVERASESGQLSAETKPIVRDRTFKCLFEWLRTDAAAEAIEAQFDQIEAILIAGLTDVWSAIRKACAVRLYTLERSLRYPHLLKIFSKCIAICRR